MILIPWQNLKIELFRYVTDLNLEILSKYVSFSLNI